VWDSNPRPPAC